MGIYFLSLFQSKTFWSLLQYRQHRETTQHAKLGENPFTKDFWANVQTMKHNALRHFSLFLYFSEAHVEVRLLEGFYA